MSARGSGSEFSAVARVLFENAAKSGIITGDSRKQFAKQLQRLATQSKRQGGSLGDVSVRMSEFVSRESLSAAELQTTKASRQVPSTSVPALNIPSAKLHEYAKKAAGVQTQTQTSLGIGSDATAASAGLGLNLHLPGLRKKPLFSLPSKTSPDTIGARPLSGDPRTTSTLTTASTVPPAPQQPSPRTSLSSTLAFDEPLPALTPELKQNADAKRNASASRSFVAIEADEDVFAPAAGGASSPSFASLEAPIRDKTIVAPKVVVREAAVPTTATPSTPAATSKKPTRQRFELKESSVDATSSFSATPSDGAASLSSSQFLSTPASTSIDDWESQREQEMNQLQAMQREHEEKLAAAAEAERLRVLGEEWATQRGISNTKSVSSDPFLPFNERIYFSSKWSDMDAALGDAIALALRDNVPLPDYTIGIAISRLRRIHLRHDQKPIIDALREKLKPLKNSKACLDLVDDFEKPEAGGSAPAPTTKPARIGGGPVQEPSLLRKLRAVVAERGTWEQVLSLYSHGASSPDSSTLEMTQPRARGLLERSVCAALVRMRRQMDRDQRLSIAMQLLAEARKKSVNIDRATTAVFAKFVRGRHAVRILGPIDAPEADEETVAMHVQFSQDEEIPMLLSSAQNLGFNLRDPKIVEALAIRQGYQDASDPMKVFAMIAEQQNDGIALNKTHVVIALNAARRADPKVPNTKEFAVAALKVVNDPSLLHFSSSFREAQRICNVLFPILYSMGMLEEIYQLYSRFEPHIDFSRSLPHETLFVNSALKQRGLPPLTDADASSLPPREVSFGRRDAPIGSDQDMSSRSTSSATGSVQSSSASTTLDSIISTDSMLEYAKEHNWVAALGLLQRLPSRISASQEPTAVLLYNCAMSAASQVAPLVEQLFAEMKARKDLRPNSTSYNTVMNSLARSDAQWERAISMYHTMEPQLRDASTYSVQLSLLGKYSLWEHAIELWSDAKAAPSGKPSAALYSLGIQALHKHSWSHTLAIFQEMLKVHGVSSVKEVVALRVVKSLEDNKKFAEAQKVEHQLEKLRSKGKGKKK
jgi:hypothetical protein